MTIDVTDLEKLIKKCPNISLSNKDIIEIIESKSYNGVKSKYAKKNKPKEPEPVVEEPPVEELDEVEEVETHITECDDEGCECKSAFDEIEDV